MGTREWIITILECLAVAAIFVGFRYEDRLVAFEKRMGRAIKQLIRR